MAHADGDRARTNTGAEERGRNQATTEREIRLEPDHCAAQRGEPRTGQQHGSGKGERGAAQGSPDEVAQIKAGQIDAIENDPLSRLENMNDRVSE
jgi:hypothetical protein